MQLKNNLPELVKDESLAQIARDIDVANETVQLYAGKKAPKFFTEETRVIGVFLKLAKRLEVSFNDLFEVIK